MIRFTDSDKCKGRVYSIGAKDRFTSSVYENFTGTSSLTQWCNSFATDDVDTQICEKCLLTLVQIFYKSYNLNYEDETGKKCLKT